MGRRKSKTLTEVELEFMQVIWASGGEVTTEDVLEALSRQGRPLADGSVRKFLSILVAKGYVLRRRQGRGFLYRAKVPKDKASRNMVVDLLKRAFGGSAALMVAALLDSSEFCPDDISKIKKLIADHEKEKQP